MKQTVNNVLEFLPNLKWQGMKKQQNKAVIASEPEPNPITKTESEPKIPKKNVMIRLRIDVYQKVKTTGKLNQRNVTAEITYALMQYYNMQDPDKDAVA